MSDAELFEEAAGGEAEPGRARSGLRSRHDAGAAPAPGLFPACAKGAHRSCAIEVLVQAPWATAGEPPPFEGAKPVALERCACACGHGGKA